MKYIRILAVFFLVLWALMWLSGCSRAQYVPVETVRTDSVYLTKIQRDSVTRYDSIYIKERGDTVWLEKYRYLWRDRLVRDTLYVFRTDSVQVPLPVERKLTPWQQFKVELGGWAAGALSLALIVIAWLVYRMRRR